MQPPLPPFMAVPTKKRSASDMEDLHVSPSGVNQPFGFEENYKMMVLQFENGMSEEDVDKQFLQMALNLGINVPQDPKTTLDIVTSNVDGLALTSAPIDARPSPSQYSQSTHPPSDSSSEQQHPTKASSLTTASITSGASSFESATSRRSSYGLIKQGIRRLSTLHRRRTIDTSIRTLPSYISSTSALRPSSQTHLMTTESCPIISEPREPIAKPSYSLPPLRQTPRDPAPEDKDQDQETPAARQRSLHNARLRTLRSSQLAEQSRFIRFEADQHRLMHLKHLDLKQSALSHNTARQKAVRDRHNDALASLEHRHLSAEVDLCRTLRLEKQGCETRLRHMEAYCNPKSKVDGMPNRVVTRRDYHQLTQQYHVRNGMDNLHAARINVLREKQGKQLERVAAKQEAELSKLTSELELELRNLESKSKAEEESLAAEFSERKKRLIARWSLAEAIERRKLENETGELFAALPTVEWGDGAKEAELEDGEEESLRGMAREAVMAYDAAMVGMI